METEIINEGKVDLEVPKLEKYKSSEKEYIPSKTPVFFNPVMEITRDISVSSLDIYSREIDGLRICDALAGVGARGIRYSKELTCLDKIKINDRSSKAAGLIRKNIKRNSLENTEACEEDANILLRNHRPRFHVVDLDPFGTPVPFLDSSFSAVSRRGMMLVTATDTAPLCGAYPKPCMRKYGAKPLRNSYSRELGLRILIGSIQRRAASYDLALRPVLSHATQHFFRTHLQVDQGAKKANKLLKELGYVSHCFGCERRFLSSGIMSSLPETCECGRELDHAGPLWLGNLGDKEHLENVIEEISNRNFELQERERNLLRLCHEENDGPPTFYDLHEISSLTGNSPPKLEKVVRDLDRRDYFASKTHFLGTGFKTDAPMKEIMEIVSS